MNLIRLLSSLGPGARNRLIGGAVLSSLASTALLVIVNVGAGQLAARQSDQIDWVLALAFVATVLVYIVTESWLVASMAADVEQAVDGFRVRLIDRVRRLGLRQLEAVGEAPLFESISRSTQTISQYSQFLVLGLRSAVLCLTVMLSIAILSMTAFLLIVALLALCGWLYVRVGGDLRQRYHRMLGGENELFEGVTDLFDGFKEQRLSTARSRDLGQGYFETSRRLSESRYAVHLLAWQQFVFGEVAFYFLLGAVVFVVPVYSPSFAKDVTQVTTSVLFLMGPLFGLMQTVVVIAEAEAAAGRMFELDQQLADMAEPAGDGPPEPVCADFRELRLSGIEFAYPAPAGETPFVVGPVDMTIKRGEVVFITGGNGSGKSTLIRLLTGLYPPLRGALELDGLPVSPRRRQSYRDLTATVFSDFHLFPRLHVLGPAHQQEGADLVRLMEMERVITLDGGRFSRRELSAGQRKRLALIAALLEAKPILVLDEWAADQDPHFRQKFYRELVPMMRERGLTVIAVTHDDNYFDAADRRFHVEEGRVSELPIRNAAEAEA